MDGRRALGSTDRSTRASITRLRPVPIQVRTRGAAAPERLAPSAERSVRRYHSASTIDRPVRTNMSPGRPRLGSDRPTTRPTGGTHGIRRGRGFRNTVRVGAVLIGG